MNNHRIIQLLRSFELYKIIKFGYFLFILALLLKSFYFLLKLQICSVGKKTPCKADKFSLCKVY